MSSRDLLILFIVLFIGMVSACGDNSNGCKLKETPPPLLSATGCVNMPDPAQPAPGTIPYDINEPFWSDGAEKRRYMALPEHERIEIDADGDFIFPVGAVLIKNFRLDGKFFETRFFVRSDATAWNGYSYKWNDAQTEAYLLANAEEAVIGRQTWHFPSGEQCMKCHTAAAGFSLGLEIAQLNRNYSHAPAGEPLNQIDYLQSRGVLAEAPPEMRRLKLADSRDPAQSLDDRARSYLHSNCSHCHRPGGGTQSPMDLRAGVALADTKACDTWPLLGDLGIPNPRLVAPGDHVRSILWSRMHTPDNNRMPPWFNKVVDVDGTRLIEQWTDSLTGCVRTSHWPD